MGIYSIPYGLLGVILLKHMIWLSKDIVHHNRAPQWVYRAFSHETNLPYACLSSLHLDTTNCPRSLPCQPITFPPLPRSPGSAMHAPLINKMSLVAAAKWKVFKRCDLKQKGKGIPCRNHSQQKPE